MTSTWCCYIVQCADASLYVGITNNLDTRLRAHNTGRGARYTRSRAPVRLRWRWDCISNEDARRLEGLLKRLPRAQRLRAIDSDADVLGPILVEVAARRRTQPLQTPSAALISA
jgi:putative endonuclease